MARGDQHARQWRVIQYLVASRQGKSVNQIAAAVGGNPRTVYRDLETLEAAGFPVYTERDGNRSLWRLLDRERQRVPLLLSLSEVVALYMSRDMLRGLRGTVFFDAIDALFDKLRRTLAPPLLDYLDRLEDSLRVGLRPHKDYARHGEVLETLRRAVLERRWIEMTYYAMHRRRETRRQVAPYRLWYFDGAFYLIAFCRLRQEVRVFAVERIRVLALGTETFDIPPDFDADTFLEAGFGPFHGDPISVRIRFSPRVAGYIRERHWHRSQRLTPQPDGGLIFEAEAAGTAEIKAWVLRWGGDARVLGPKALREAVRSEIATMQSAYETRNGA